MIQTQFNRILAKIARDHHTTVAQVRREMQIAMETGQANPDPFIRARWAAIPRKGKELTLEEFIAYIAHQI